MQEYEQVILKEMRILPMVRALYQETRQSTMVGSLDETGDYCVKTFNSYVRTVKELRGDDFLDSLILEFDGDVPLESKVAHVAVAAAQLAAYLEQHIGIVADHKVSYNGCFFNTKPEKNKKAKEEGKTSE